MPVPPAAGDAPALPSSRIERIDALRGLALLAILQVNIQSYCWGPGDPLGYPAAAPDELERALLFVQSLLFEGKFRPLLGFLFGAALALQFRAHGRPLHHAPPAWAWRRSGFLLLAGLAHGLLLYFGDALVTYAACGTTLVLARWARWDPRALALAAWSGLALSLGVQAYLQVGALDPDAETAQAFALVSTHTLYGLQGYAGQWPQRLQDALWQQLGTIPFGWPEQFAWAATGWLAAQMGWTREQGPRSPRALRWQALAVQAGWLVGVPCALASASLHLQRFGNSIEPGPLESLFASLGTLVTFLYLDLGSRLLGWLPTLRGLLANVGRIPLTNYIAQSLAMLLLLSGAGLRLESVASRADLALLAFWLALIQVTASTLWLRAHRSGPLEWAWRRWTYGRGEVPMRVSPGSLPAPGASGEASGRS